MNTVQPRGVDRPRPRIGLIGTGPMARSFAALVVRHHPDLVITKVLTRRGPTAAQDFLVDVSLTESADDLIEHADIVVECSGDVAHATHVIDSAFRAERPVVTLNAELHVTTGSWLAGRGLLTEAEGDQPGSIAALHEEVIQMGFHPLVYGNMKGFLNLDPSPEDMNYWAKRQGISVPNTTGATDGTKVQIEQAFVANGLGATITRTGLQGPKSDDLGQAAHELAALADALGRPIADYVLAVKWAPTGVFVVARHDDDLKEGLARWKLGAGPYYLLVKPFHLCSLEVVKTVRRVLSGQGVLLNNSLSPRIGVAALAKHALQPGVLFERGAGGFQARGEAVRLIDQPDHVPIGILAGAVVRRPLEPGQIVTRADVDLPETGLVDIALASVQDALSLAHAA